MTTGMVRVTWEEYVEIYWSHIVGKVEDISRRLELMEGDVTLCCWEKSFKRCHRSIAARLLDILGIESEVF